MQREVYSGRLKFYGEEHSSTIRAALNLAASLVALKSYQEGRSIMLKMTPVARRVLGDTDRLTFKMRLNYATTLWMDAGATLDDLREAMTTLEEAERTARRVFGGAHPLTTAMEDNLRQARAALRARETGRTASSIDNKIRVI